MEFVVLPDSLEATPTVRTLLPRNGYREIRHASGRPWLMGDWDERDLTLVSLGDRRLVTIGRTRVDQCAASRILERARSLADLDAIAAELPGCHFLLASFDGEVRAQGSLSTARQIFFANHNGISLAANSPRPLTSLIGSRLDTDVMAARLLSPLGPPWPVFQRCIWSGVTAVTAGHWLRLRRTGPTSMVRWWSAPEPELPLDRAAARLIEALFTAVSLRIDDHGCLSADLSGGFDSTSLCFVAAAVGADLITYHVAPLDRANADSTWARMAASHLRTARHRVLSAGRAENYFDVSHGPEIVRTHAEGPPTWTSGLGHVLDLSVAASGEGATAHLMGLGGDELFGLMPVYLWTLLRRSPVRGMATARGFQLRNRWPLGETLKGLFGRSRFAPDLGVVAEEICRPRPRSAIARSEFGWTAAPTLPPWATPETIETVQRVLQEAAASRPEPLGADRLRHQILSSIVFEGTTIRHINNVVDGDGPRWEAPLLDAHVIEAALSLRVADRFDPRQPKPLLARAMRGVAPSEMFDRRDKGEFSAEMFEGLRRNRDRLLALCEDSRLAELGLIDASVLRTRLLNPGTLAADLGPFENTLAHESWLRSLDAARADT